jgi:hypothetical protein
MTRVSLLCTAIGLMLSLASNAQQIILDEPVRAGGLIYFQKLGDESSFYYAPAKARLAQHANGKPQFSFLRYVSNIDDDAAENTEGEGGGIVHAVVELGVTDEERAEAMGELRRQRPGAKDAGPVIFKAGKFGLVSSFKDESGDLTTRVVGLGTAPVLDGSRAAVSIQLTKLGAKVLWQSFQTATPDISFMFEMEMAGFRAPKRAMIEAELDRVYEHSAFEAGVATTFFQAQISEAFDDLFEQGAIKLTQVGDDEDLESLIQTAYSKISELIFQPSGAGLQTQIQQAAAAGQKSALDRASELLQKSRQEVREDNQRVRRENREERDAVRRGRLAALQARLGAAPTPAAGGTQRSDSATAALARERAESFQRYSAHLGEADDLEDAPVQQQEQELPGFAAVVTYEMKRVRQRGRYRVDLNKYTAETLPVRFDENIGDLTRWIEDEEVFRSINLDDDLYRQREIIASLMSVSDSDFEDFLGFVSFQIRKTHGGGQETLEEERIDRKAFNDLGNRFKLVYGWKGDASRKKWSEYEYRTLWAFNDVEPIEGPWTPSTFAGIALSPPFEKRSVQLEATDQAVLSNAGVRSITVRLYSQLGGKEKLEQVTLRSSNGELSKTVDLVLPRGTTEYEYEIKWLLRGNKTLTTGRRATDQDVLYVDELPEA